MSITGIVLIYLTIRYISTPCLLVDFPCFYDLENNHLETQFIEPDSIKDLIIFISDIPEHASGGGCFSTSIANGGTYDYDNICIEIQEQDILVNNQLIGLGNSVEFKSTYIDFGNLWWIYDRQIKLKNNGPIFSIQDGEVFRKFEYERQFVAGFDSTEERLNYWTLGVFCCLTCYLILLIIRKFKRRTLTRQ